MESALLGGPELAFHVTENDAEERINPTVSPEDAEWIQTYEMFEERLDSDRTIGQILSEFFTEHEARMFIPSDRPVLKALQDDNTQRFNRLLDGRFHNLNPDLATKLTMLFFGFPVAPMEFDLDILKDNLEIREPEAPRFDVQPPLHFLTAHKERNWGDETRLGQEDISYPLTVVPPNGSVHLRGGADTDGEDFDREDTDDDYTDGRDANGEEDVDGEDAEDEKADSEIGDRQNTGIENSGDEDTKSEDTNSEDTNSERTNVEDTNIETNFEDANIESTDSDDTDGQDANVDDVEDAAGEVADGEDAESEDAYGEIADGEDVEGEDDNAKGANSESTESEDTNSEDANIEDANSRSADDEDAGKNADDNDANSENTDSQFNDSQDADDEKADGNDVYSDNSDSENSDSESSESSDGEDVCSEIPDSENDDNDSDLSDVDEDYVPSGESSPKLNGGEWIDLHGFQGIVPFVPGNWKTFATAIRQLLSLRPHDTKIFTLVHYDKKTSRTIKEVYDSLPLQPDSSSMKYLTTIVQKKGLRHHQECSAFFVQLKREMPPSNWKPGSLQLGADIAQIRWVPPETTPELENSPISYCYISLPKLKAKAHESTPQTISDWGANQCGPFVQTALEVLVGRPQNSFHHAVFHVGTSDPGSGSVPLIYGLATIGPLGMQAMLPSDDERIADLTQQQQSDDQIAFVLPGYYPAGDDIRETFVQKQGDNRFPNATESIRNMVNKLLGESAKSLNYVRLLSGSLTIGPHASREQPYFSIPMADNIETRSSEDLDDILTELLRGDPFVLLYPEWEVDDTFLSGPDETSVHVELPPLGSTVCDFRACVTAMMTPTSQSGENPSLDMKERWISIRPLAEPTVRMEASGSVADFPCFYVGPKTTENEWFGIRARIPTRGAVVDVLKKGEWDWISRVPKSNIWGPRYGLAAPSDAVEATGEVANHTYNDMPSGQNRPSRHNRPSGQNVPNRDSGMNGSNATTARQRGQALPPAFFLARPPGFEDRQRTWATQPSILDGNYLHTWPGNSNIRIPKTAPPSEQILRTGSATMMMTKGIMTPTEQARLQKEHWDMRNLILDRVVVCPYSGCNFMYRFDQQEEIQNHLDSKHVMIKCLWCDKVFGPDDARSIKRHMRDRHKEEMWDVLGVARATLNDHGGSGTLSIPLRKPQPTSREDGGLVGLGAVRTEKRPTIQPLRQAQAKQTFCDRCGRNFNDFYNAAEGAYHSRNCRPNIYNGAKCKFCTICGGHSWLTTQDAAMSNLSDGMLCKCKHDTNGPVGYHCARCGLDMEKMPVEARFRHRVNCKGYGSKPGSFCCYCGIAFPGVNGQDDWNKNFEHMQICCLRGGVASRLPEDPDPQAVAFEQQQQRLLAQFRPSDPPNRGSQAMIRPAAPASKAIPETQRRLAAPKPPAPRRISTLTSVELKRESGTSTQRGILPNAPAKSTNTAVSSDALPRGKNGRRARRRDGDEDGEYEDSDAEGHDSTGPRRGRKRNRRRNEDGEYEDDDEGDSDEMPLARLQKRRKRQRDGDGDYEGGSEEDDDDVEEGEAESSDGSTGGRRRKKKRRRRGDGDRDYIDDGEDEDDDEATGDETGEESAKEADEEEEEEGPARRSKSPNWIKHLGVPDPDFDPTGGDYYCSKCFRKAPKKRHNRAGSPLGIEAEVRLHADPHRCCKIRHGVGSAKNLPNRSGWVLGSVMPKPMSHVRNEFLEEYPAYARTLYPLQPNHRSASFWRSDPNNDKNAGWFDLPWPPYEGDAPLPNGWTAPEIPPEAPPEPKKGRQTPKPKVQPDPTYRQSDNEEIDLIPDMDPSRRRKKKEKIPPNPLPLAARITRLGEPSSLSMNPQGQEAGGTESGTSTTGTRRSERKRKWTSEKET